MKKVTRVIYGIYANPADYPGRYVARKFTTFSDGSVEPETIPLCVDISLLKVRSSLPAGFRNWGRSLQDDPCLLEAWGPQ